MPNPNKVRWTIERDEHIRAGRAQNKSFRQLGRELGVARNSVIDRAGQLGIYTRKKRDQPVKAIAPPKPDGRRAPGGGLPLPAGSLETWSIISSTPYPTNKRPL